MTVPPNYSMPPERQPNPGYGFGPQYGGPSLPEERGPRNYGLIGAIVVGCTVLALGSILLVAFVANQGDDGEPVADDGTTTPAEDESTTPADDVTTPEDDTTTPAGDDGEIGQCLPYEPVIVGDGLELTDCDDAEAFWKITNQSYDIDATVDDEGNLESNQVAYDLCGEDYATSFLGEPWTNWHWVYSSGSVDSLYCIEALGNPDDEGRLPYTPDTGDCFDESDQWWTVPCDSDLAVYKVVDTVVFDEPQDLDDDAAAEAATCGGEYYWEITDVEGLTTAILCGNEL
ncbi:hypothetical protein [Glycomyces arizonensis]|uniref:hypothetical protein n=1 Tax=Glycomyces arizonensis TaxID=256035 RepID=UPI000404DD16|nr:hypothetical protein [Glycomyces arizonensis]